MVDGPIRREMDLQKHLTTLWLAIPDSIHEAVKDDPAIVKLPDRKAARFYTRGEIKSALEHVAELFDDRPGLPRAADISGEFKRKNIVWLTTLTPEMRGTNRINECWIELK
jgi:hypothetical protein